MKNNVKEWIEEGYLGECEYHEGITFSEKAHYERIELRQTADDDIACVIGYFTEEGEEILKELWKQRRVKMAHVEIEHKEIE